MKRFNLYWISVKQLRMSQWLQEKLFLIGLAIHIWKKYHKLNPSIADIYAYQHGGVYPRRGTLDYWGGESYAIKDGDVTLKVSEELPLKSRIMSSAMTAKDLLEGKLDSDQALFDQYFSQLQADLEKIKQETK